MSKKTSAVWQLGMAEARLRLPELAKALAREPDRIVRVTRRGRPVFDLVAPPRIERKAGPARRILQRVAQIEARSPRITRDVARHYTDVLYGRA